MKRLDRETVDRIAAGEVVTRPARVVVELVENALDAGADRIEVEVWGDGTERLRVADDGRGMGTDEAVLAVERHTTSKLPDGDLESVETLGFRGEALASVADVARLTLSTNDGGPRGTRVRVDGCGVTVDSVGRGRGTTVEVRDLFHNRPARAESLAAPSTEFERISDRVATYALCRPSTAFTLDHDDRRVFATPGSGAFTDAALSVYGREVARESTTLDTATTVPVGDRETDVALRGLLAYPSVTRATADHVRVAVNGRPVSLPPIWRAVERGYGSLLPGDRHPVTALSVSLPPRAVDPNVHPTKETVALRSTDDLTDAVEAAVEDALSTADLRRSAEVAMDLDSALDPVDADAGESALADAEYLGRFDGLYLLCDAGDDLLVVDQHAAHERINYERLRAAVEEEGVPSATLDPPATLSLSPADVAAVESHAADLSRLGFDCEPFGGGTVRVRAVPAPLGRVAEPEALRETLAALRDGDDAGRRDVLLADLACHPSLKAGDALDDDEAAALVDRLGACEHPFACPHGRPTVLAIDEAHLAGGFDRHPRRG
ncbi:DNA mismatch repair endonuclease MutL [Haloplanus salilacus]|uniref:DNA mismatch repair endonuclease MutL n=1 Tax=Haloplanus salilacus TaxID=2949994 RepID=UPI0030D32156